MNGNKVERISKKYQWIGLHEYLGLLSDSLLFREWDGTERPMQGAWELLARDYDPSVALAITEEAADVGEKIPAWWSAPSPVGAAVSVVDKQKWVAADFASFEPYVRVRYDDRAWIVLHAHINFEEALGFGVEYLKSAQMTQWIDVRVFLLPKKELSKKLRVLSDKNFFGDGCDIPSAHQCWITEYPWHPMLIDADEACLSNETWLRNLEQEFFMPVCELSDESMHILLPAPTLYRQLNELSAGTLTAPRFAADGSMEICGTTGQSIIKGTVHGARVLMVDELAMRRCLKAKDYALVWAVLSEKSAWDGSSHVGGLAVQSAVYALHHDGAISGGMTKTREYEPPENLLRK